MALVTNRSAASRGVHVVGSHHLVMLAPDETRELELLSEDHPVIHAWIEEGHLEIVHPEVVEADPENEGEPEETQDADEDGEPDDSQAADTEDGEQCQEPSQQTRSRRRK